MTDKLQDAVQLACEAIAALEAAEAENATLRIRIAELESLCKEYVQAIQSHIDKEKNGSK